MKNWKLVLLATASKEIIETGEWYQEINTLLAKRFKKEIRLVLSKIKVSPFNYSFLSDEIRRAQLPHFPYVIHFTTLEATEQILILGCYHTSRDPDLWRNVSND